MHNVEKYLKAIFAKPISSKKIIVLYKKCLNVNWDLKKSQNYFSKINIYTKFKENSHNFIQIIYISVPISLSTGQYFASPLITHSPVSYHAHN